MADADEVRSEYERFKVRLSALVARLRYHVLQKKRWDMWSTALKRFHLLTVDDLHERCDVKDLSALRLKDVLLQ